MIPVFFNDDYVIKGVAGAILWRLIRTWVDTGRQDFSNRELRLDTSLPHFATVLLTRVGSQPVAVIADRLTV